MINDHLPGTSCSIHGCSRVDEISECSLTNDCLGGRCNAVAMAPLSCRNGGATQRPPVCVSVLILMCTYNGQGFLEKQLASIKKQTCQDWHVAISDDGSEDATVNITNRYRYLWGEDKVSLWRGPQRGFARNFISTVCNKELSASYYAWCDQDDVWDERKLQAALAWLQSVPASIPALYFGRTELVDQRGQVLGYSPLFRRPPSFANALVQNIGGGNTMVLNHAARLLLEEAGQHLDIVSHDWWAYILITGVGGNVFYDVTPYVHYRQHGANLVGSNRGWAARIVRIRMLFQGRFRHWNAVNIAGLETIQHRLTDENRLTLEAFKALRSRHFPGRLLSLKRSGVYRQTLLGNLGLLLATLINGV
ncbi:glycosyltransferase family 2 protein [Pseudomonas quasicaspiana]|uniref:glycosyltransferase family 2 protein n=2 Tax=Pseudomonas quasicaspiana TaxID=2829821 RepID=UPI001E518CA2|nr:glycosyltransferase family 2 protein [Pseudomonas quasicaspiana]